MELNNLERKLFEEIEEIEIIDAHEHLPPEEERLKMKVDIFTLFSHYTHYDLLNAGMKEEEYKSLFNHDIPLEKRWKTFSPYWEKIRYTSYSKAVLLAVKKFYGVSEINEKTYKLISERIKEKNKKGIYENVLRKACNIKTCLTQCGRTDLKSDLLIPVMPLIYGMEKKEDLINPPFEKTATIKTLDDYLESLKNYILRVKKEGTVGLKMVSLPYGNPDRKKAESLFRKVISGLKIPTPQWPDFPDSNPLKDYVVDFAIKFAGEKNLVIAVHTGYWGDFRKLNPTHMIPILQRHPEVKFDIYHCGYPYMREALMLGKGFPNVYLNFCWVHIISQKFAQTALDEAIDLIPVNKIIAFGGDYSIPVEKVYGHLVMAKEDIVKVFARRIKETHLKKEEAINIIKRWFFENPSILYNLKRSENEKN
jgi:predicted TIM-barrel fold metal-dependent hydrolase